VIARFPKNNIRNTTISIGVRISQYWGKSATKPKNSNVPGRSQREYYGVTIPTSTHNAAGGVDFINLLIGKEGQAVLIGDSQTPIVPAIASGTGIPAAIQPNVKTT
jgi:ABC-type molybdate transport system substrate-binding protein